MKTTEKGRHEIAARAAVDKFNKSPAFNTTTLDREQLATFVSTMFKYADSNSYVSLRTFPDDGKHSRPSSIRAVKWVADDVVEAAYEEAERAAANPRVVVFSPPVATFVSRKSATENNVADGVALAVECDQRPKQALATLTALLGDPTLVVASGGIWVNPGTDKEEQKLHLYWRLATPARGDEALALLKQARRLAATLVDADKSGAPICHPMRWPGSLHRKKTPAVLCKILEVHDEREIALDEALTLLREAVGAPPKPKAPRVNNMPPVDIAEIQTALDATPADDYGVWFEVGCALYKELGDEKGWPVFEQWSQKSEKYDKRQCEQQWEECGKVKGFNPGTIFHHAKDAEDALRAAQVAENIKIGEEIDEPITPTILTLPEMLKRLVWIADGGGAVVDKVTGRLRKFEVAGREYAASRHGKKEGAALPLWLASPQRMGVDVLAWVPGAPQICSPPEGDGKAFNTWRGLTPMKAPKDWKTRAKPFVDHVAFLVPVPSERKHFMQWLAHIVQQPEVLPHTFYLMVATKTGIGRNLMVGMITRALRGHVANGISLPSLLKEGSFNGRLSRKLLATVDELREGNSGGRYQRQEALKTIVTEEHRHINPKFGLQSVEKNCCRWLFLSNHLDAIPFDNSDRRARVVENPLIPKPPEYYAHLYKLLNDPEFIGSIRRTLEEWPLDDFNPGEHAPMNAAKIKALEAMQTETERACLQFKEDCVTDLAAREDIHWLATSGEKRPVNPNHLTHAIESAGMVSPGRNIKHRGHRKTVVVVRNHELWTRERVKQASAESLLKAMGLDPT